MKWLLEINRMVWLANIAIAAAGLSNRTQSIQRLATAKKFLRRCVTQALSRVDAPRYSLHASE